MIPMNVSACSAETLPKSGAGTLGSFGPRTRPSLSARGAGREDLVQDAQDVTQDPRRFGSVARHCLDRSSVDLDRDQIVLHVGATRRWQILLLQGRERGVANQVMQPL